MPSASASARCCATASCCRTAAAATCRRERLDLIPGTVIANPDGFGFLRPDSGAGDDLFLPPYEMRKAMHGDRVLASVTGVDRRGRREGAIVEVLERRLNRLIGRFEVESGISYVVPDDRRVQRNIQIPGDARLDAKHGQLVVCEIVQAPTTQRPPIGRILAVLGDKLTASLAVEAAIHGHEIPHEFPPEVLAEATAVPLEVDAATAAARVDLRQLPLVTIDGEDAKDFDDAVYCEPNRDGFRLVVAIADVSHYVRPGTPLDEEATKRATSVYFPGFVVPMLPETLSNGICSLKPKVDRLCFVCDMQVDRSGHVSGSKFYEAVMNSHERLTYTQVWNAVGEGVPDEDREQAQAFIGAQLPQVQRLHQLYRVLDKARKQRGAIEFESSEVRFVLGPQGEVTQAGMLQRNDAHKLIEECMIAANVEAAKFLLDTHIPAPYRDHDKPPEAKYADLLEFLERIPAAHAAVGEGAADGFPQAAGIDPRPPRCRAAGIGGAAQPEPGGVRARQHRPLRPGAGGLRAFHLADPALSGPAGASRDQARPGGRQRRQLPVFEQRHGGVVAAVLGALAPRRRGAARSRRPLSRGVDGTARRQRVRRHHQRRHQFRPVHRARRFQGQRPGARDPVAERLLPLRSDPQDAGRRTQRAQFRLGDRVRIVVLKASLEERKIDFRLVEEGGRGAGTSTGPAAFAPRAAKGGQVRDAGVRQKPPRGQPAKRAKKPY